MRETWKSLLYLVLIGSLPLAFWYAMLPHRKKLHKTFKKPIIDSDGP
jgi:hypothetical protein